MVIAIIAILAALLVPAMKKARYMALRASCSVNIRQQLIGITSYARDHDGTSPPLIDRHKVGWPGDNWMRDFDLNDWGGLGLLWTGDYVKWYSAYLCPAGLHTKNLLLASWPNGQPATPENPGIHGSYVIETEYMVRNLYYQNGVYEESNGLIDSQMGLVAVYDGVQGFSLRHQDGLNVGYYDGHIAWFTDPTGEYFLPYWDYGGWGELMRRWNDLYARMDSP